MSQNNDQHNAWIRVFQAIAGLGWAITQVTCCLFPILLVVGALLWGFISSLMHPH